MRLERANSIFNMGDTSLRVKELMEVYKLTLPILEKHKYYYPKWQRNQENQKKFYETIIDEFIRIDEEEGTNLFKDFNRSEKGGLDKRHGRFINY